MFFLILLVAAIILALARGGKITNLAFVKFRWSGLILTGFLIQVVIFTPIWQDWSELVPLTATFYLTSLELLILALAANFRLPGMWLVTLGFAFNFAAIAANGGYMPALPSALDLSGLPALLPGEIMNNSIGIGPDTPFAFLGDIFAFPQSWPFANVFSVGDVLIATGVAILTYGVTVRAVASTH